MPDWRAKKATPVFDRGISVERHSWVGACAMKPTPRSPLGPASVPLSRFAQAESSCRSPDSEPDCEHVDKKTRSLRSGNHGSLLENQTYRNRIVCKTASKLATPIASYNSLAPFHISRNSISEANRQKTTKSSGLFRFARRILDGLSKAPCETEHHESRLRQARMQSAQGRSRRWGIAVPALANSLLTRATSPLIA